MRSFTDAQIRACFVNASRSERKNLTLPADVDAGRRGDTVGTLICENFECSQNVRKLPPSAYLGFDREAARERRITALRHSVDGFVRDVRGED